MTRSVLTPEILREAASDVIDGILWVRNATAKAAVRHDPMAYWAAWDVVGSWLDEWSPMGDPGHGSTFLLLLAEVCENPIRLEQDQ